MLTTLGLVLFLDLSTKSFFREIHRRFKTDINNVDFDVIFFGSSRVIHGVNNKKFTSLVGKSSLNMGWAACNPREVYAAVKVYLARNKRPELIFIQLDFEHNLTEEDKLAQQDLLKFYNSDIINDYYSQETRRMMDIPLMSFVNNRDFGWREILKTCFRNNLYKNIERKDFGYFEIEPAEFISSQNITEDKIIEMKNIWITKIIDTCRAKGIKVILYTAPYFGVNSSEQFDFFKVYNVPYFNYSDLLKSQIYFKDYNHTNRIGTDSLTVKLSSDLLELNAL
jgi:hypothetical protein